MRKQKGELTALAAILIGALAAPLFTMVTGWFEPEPTKPCYYQTEYTEGNKIDVKAKWVDDCSLTNEQALGDEEAFKER
ncbi:TMhelix containing protein [Vibrio phage 1.275.O._10N.286.54.E11]|nr:TMhelix containing protein [Vibrio phage 1.275.O._10N.286.54.E11]